MRASSICMALLASLALLACAPLAVRADLPLTEWVMTVSAPTLDVPLTINNTQFVNATAVTMGDRRTLTYTVNVPVSDPLLTISPSSTWVWQRGSQQPNISADEHQVTLRIEDQTVPASRRGAAQFKDGENNMWIYGGQNPSGDRTADFYRYNRQTNQFTLFSGGLNLLALTNVAPAYMTMGVSDPSTSPGSRSHACVASNAVKGEFWMYGGKRNDATVQADLFRFAAAGDERWTWIAGNQSTNIAASYPAGGVGTTGGYPGSRYGASCWTSATGMRVFLFGGFDANDNLKSDLWMWNQMDLTWTWLAGSDSAGSIAATDADVTAPLPRGYALAMGPDSSSRFYLAFGTASNSAGDVGAIGDLWSFTLTGSTGSWVTTWTYVKGSRIIADDASAVFGALGVAGSSLQPGARAQCMGDINKAAGHLIISGGLGFDSTGAQGILADVWKFEILTGQWMWLSGANTVGAAAVFPQGAGPVSALATPGARCDGAGWIDGSGSYFTGFGSVSTGAIAQLKNDLWRLAAGSGPVFITITPTPSPAYISSVSLSLGVLNTHYMLELPTTAHAVGVYSSLRFMVTSPGSSCPDFTLILIPCARNTDNGWAADVTATGRPGVTTLLSSTFTPDQGVFALPASAAFGQALIDFKLPNGATLSPFATKHAVVTLPNTGANISYPFRVTSQSGANSSLINLQFQVARSSNNFWQALVTAPGGATTPLSSSSTALQGQFVLPASSANGVVFVSFLLPYGAQVISATALAPIQLGSTDSTVISTFFVQAQDGTASAPFSLQFHVAPSVLTSWSAIVAWNQPGVPRIAQSVSSATASPTTIFHLPLSVLDVVNNVINITVTPADGASLGAGNPLSVLLALTGKLPGDQLSFAFHVEAQAGGGIVGATYTFVLILDPVPSSTGNDFINGGSTGPSGGLTLVTQQQALSDSQLAGVIAGSIVFLIVAVAAAVILYKACCVSSAASAAAGAGGAASSGAAASGGVAAAGAPSEIPMAQL